jgi:hypothetical protein
MTSLPALVDRKTLARETGLPRSTVDVIFQTLNVVALPGHRKVYVKRAEVAAYIAANTFTKDQVRA